MTKPKHSSFLSESEIRFFAIEKMKEVTYYKHCKALHFVKL